MITGTQIMGAVFGPALLCQSENWNLASREGRMLTTAGVGCLGKAAGKTGVDKIRNEEIRRRVGPKHATSGADGKRDRVVIAHEGDGTNGSPELRTRDPAGGTTTEGKATKSVRR